MILRPLLSDKFLIFGTKIEDIRRMVDTENRNSPFSTPISTKKKILLLFVFTREKFQRQTITNDLFHLKSVMFRNRVLEVSQSSIK